MDSTRDDKKVYIEDLREGMVLSDDVVDRIGNLLLPGGISLTKSNFSTLEKSGLRSVRVLNTEINKTEIINTEINNKDTDKDIADKIAAFEANIIPVTDRPDFKEFSREYQVKTVKIREALIGIGNGGEIKLDKLFELTDDIISKIKFKSDLFSYMNHLKYSDEHTFVHSTNVSLLCHLFSSWLKLSEEEASYLTAAGLLHDVGKTHIDPVVLNKKGMLTKEEFETIKTHTTLGYGIIRNHNIPLDVKLAVLSHHEKIDGSGYPMGLTDANINRFAKIVAICDIYDAMTTNRVYRDKICPFHVIRQFEQRSYGQLDTEYLLSFLKNIARIYIGSYVKLSDGTRAQVMVINQNELSRPMVRRGLDIVDLKEQNDLSIDEVL